MKPARKQTKASRVQEILRDDIICGRIAAGEKLAMDALKERYKVGYSPLREALCALVSLGLVKQEEQCGFYVTPMSIEELNDLYEIRSHIETLALEMAIENGDETWEAQIIASWHIFSKYLDPKNKNRITQAEWERLQKIFLNALVQGCNSPWLLKIFNMLYDQASRYRGICIRNHQKDKKLMTEFIKQTQQLVDAVIARDIKKVHKLNTASWESTKKTITKALTSQKLTK